MSLGPLMLGIQGAELQDDERDMLLHPLVGGIVLFARNYESPAQLAALVTEIHHLRDPHLLVAVDQEGGRVQRFRNGFTLLPAIGRLGDIYDSNAAHARQLAQTTGWLMAVELRAVGIDFSFAPVVDLNNAVSKVIGDRGFHRDPEVVADLAQHYIRGMHQAGMAATIKHFPGHGSVMEDSHLSAPVYRQRFEDLQSEDMLPFERLCHIGVEGMMIAHIIYEQVDACMAGFSSFWVQQVLRRRLGFEGIVFSDDLEMEGAAVAGDIPDRVQAALQAGCDMVLVCQTAVAMNQALGSIKEWRNPVSQLRLIRMHGRQPVSRVQLQHDVRWQEAVGAVQGYDEPHTLDLL